MITPEQLDELERLEKQATPGPWGWTNHGEKCNCAVLGIFYNKTDEQVGGHVTEEVYDEHTGDYKRVVEFCDAIATKEDDANYTDFALLAELRNLAPTLISTARSHAALEAEIQHAIREAKSYEPDYPWTQNTITEAVRALGSSLQGTSQANADLHAENKRLREALEKIARYDSGNGCCTYGCDTPTIAKITLGEQA